MGEERVEQVVTLEVPAGYDEGVRIDRYVTRFLPNVSRTKVQRGIMEGHVAVNGDVVEKTSQVVQPGDTIVCTIMKPPPIEAQPEKIPLDIVFEDEHLIVVNKAAGMVVHPAYGNRTGTLVNALLYYVGAGSIEMDDVEEDDLDDDEVGLSTVNAIPRGEGDPSVRPGIVHRLDKDTSGLLVVAKNDVVHRHLARQFADHSTERRYLAILWGVPSAASGTIEGNIGRDPRDRKKMAVVPHGRGKHAVTHYEIVEPFEYTALAAFRLETGRTHQIRVHAAHIHHPVLADVLYGGKALRYGPNTANRRAYYANLFDVLRRQALHAETLAFVHPATEERVVFRADVPPDMAAALEKLQVGG